MRPLRVLAATAAVALGLGLAAAAPSSAAGTSDVSVLHGVPGLTVDVYANGNKLLTDFEPGTLTDPVKLPEGTYDLAVFPAGEGPDGTPAIKADGVAVPSGANITIVAHLSADGTPVLTPFVNDTSRIKPGETRLTVRHTAAAPAVDVRAGGTPVFEGLENPKEAKADIPAGKVSADVVLAGTDTVAIGPADLDLKEGTNTIVYAWGSAADNEPRPRRADDQRPALGPGRRPVRHRWPARGRSPDAPRRGDRASRSPVRRSPAGARCSRPVAADRSPHPPRPVAPACRGDDGAGLCPTAVRSRSAARTREEPPSCAAGGSLSPPVWSSPWRHPSAGG